MLEPKYIEISTINPSPYNPRSITTEEFDGLRASIKKFGQVENLILNKDLTLISGHMRLKAMTQLGYTQALCIILDLSKVDEKKLNILMNSHAIAGKFDDLKLAELLEELKSETDYIELRLDKLEQLDLSEPRDEEEKLNLHDKVCPKCGHIFQ
jgi:ParB-like chromosome segregation protein Spo0J